MNESSGNTRRSAHIPTLHASDLDPRVYARSTCFTAGHLVSTNAGWRNVRPVIVSEACTGCLECYLYCPDGALFKTDGRAAAPVAVDYDFCKGCGICARVCRFGALSMISEREAPSVDSAGGNDEEAHAL